MENIIRILLPNGLRKIPVRATAWFNAHLHKPTRTGWYATRSIRAGITHMYLYDAVADVWYMDEFTRHVHRCSTINHELGDYEWCGLPAEYTPGQPLRYVQRGPK